MAGHAGAGMIRPQRFVPRHDCHDIRVGDVVVRMLAGEIPMELTVSAVRDDVFLCAVPGLPVDEGWTFDRTTGMEVDDELMSGPRWGICISWIARQLEAQ